MTISKSTMIGLALLGASATAYAAADVATHPNAARVEAARDRVAWEAQTTKGSPSAVLRLEERRLQNLLDRLEQGERVDPNEIDRELNQAR